MDFKFVVYAKMDLLHFALFVKLVVRFAKIAYEQILSHNQVCVLALMDLY